MRRGATVVRPIWTVDPSHGATVLTAAASVKGGTATTPPFTRWLGRRPVGMRTARRRCYRAKRSAVPPLDDVAVLHHVVLALDAGAASGASLGDGAGGDEVVVVDDLGLDE